MLFPKGREGFRQSPKGLCHQNNLEVMLSPRSSFVDGLDAAPTAATPMLTTAKTLAGVPQALMEGRVLFSAKLSALMAATSVRRICHHPGTGS